ncbi:LysE family translocator [Crossiella sp. CA-258035]|uniref:LysE family translocator n=1 Tax=Crossiella sp. CA-258035 TaxID=2981138 RepID=UPI0024BCA016|nr:LysE family translocator [Crossiella sp. CA-258035]WHT19330.1 LysE family translocator [Crossiella sp. CA-258035]
MDVVTWPFVLTCLAVVVAPGPSLAVIVNQALRAGRTTGLATIAGNTSGLVFWAAASALGLTALVRTSEVAFVVLKVVGAAYLCFLGVQTLLRSRRHLREQADLAAGERPTGLWPAYRAGLLANLANPKAAALYLALLPQFLPAEGSVLTGTAVLAVVQMAISAGWYGLVVLAVSTVRRVLSKPVVRARLDQVSGLVLVGMGVRMATLTRATL